jgi:ATP-binding cassette subfamily C protein
MFENKKIKLEENQSLVLRDCDRFWMITSGEVDVFYAAIDKKGKYSSSLKYLYSSKSGELLFSLLTSENKQDDYKLIAVSKGASIVAINKHKLLDIDSLFLKSMIDTWVLKTAHKIQQSHRPRV